MRHEGRQITSSDVPHDLEDMSTHEDFLKAVDRPSKNYLNFQAPDSVESTIGSTSELVRE